MKALSLKEPFASMMLNGKIETRTWSTNYRGLVIFCATKKAYSLKELMDISTSWQRNQLDKFYESRLKEHGDLSGKAIATGWPNRSP